MFTLGLSVRTLHEQLLMSALIQLVADDVYVMVYKSVQMVEEEKQRRIKSENERIYYSFCILPKCMHGWRFNTCIQK